MKKEIELLRVDIESLKKSNKRLSFTVYFLLGCVLGYAGTGIATYLLQ